ncbi:NAD(P)-dependent oxidoreductase [Nitratireductor thuwali]|uniref:Phosphogluconate dehydrogenase n=1 Tax=Nitratireductor thuwali TaxID=2267699 RepID=A0ABY5MIS7_9HYPH|nr:hypothetical protein NTH_01139 [Nitratireductor thuwali]
MKRIGFLGFGEAARAFRASLAARDPALRFLAYDILLREEAAAPQMRAAMAAEGVAACDPAGLAEADWLFSAVTADQSVAALREVAPYLRQGQLVIDINSVSPARKRESAAMAGARSAAYLDMAVMAPVHPHGHRTPVLIAGEAAHQAGPELARLGFDFDVAGPHVGQATGIKLVRSLFVKGLEAITVETLLAAQAAGCLDQILQSLGRSFPGLGWPDFAAYEFERTLRHGRRRAAEMRESAAAMRELGLSGDMAEAIAGVQDQMGAAPAPPPAADNLAEGIGAVFAARNVKGGKAS